MLIFIGILLLIGGILLFVLSINAKTAYGKKVKDYNDEMAYHKQKLKAWEASSQRYDKPHAPSKPTRNNFPSNSLILGLIVAGIFTFALNGLFFYAQSGVLYAVQYPTGGDKMVSTQGIKMKWYGNLIPISYEIAIQDTIGKNPSEDDIYYRKADNYEFSDAINADIAVTTIFNIDYTDAESFLTMAENNRSEGKLVFSRIMPVVDQAIKNTCKLMDAQDYIAGAAAEFDRQFQDQLENGMYVVESYYEDDNTTNVIGDTNTVRTVGAPSMDKRKKWRIVYDANGQPKRDNTNNSLKAYGLSVVMATVVKVNWEEKFDKRLDLQKEQVAQTQLEKQEAEKEYYRAEKERAKGEADKAAEQAKLEKEQIKRTVAAETEAKVAEFMLIEEKKLFEVAQYQAKTTKTIADADAYKARLLVQAGLSPLEVATINKETAIGVARELKELDLPDVYISGNQGSSNTGLIESLIGADLAKTMMKTAKTK